MGAYEVAGPSGGRHGLDRNHLRNRYLADAPRLERLKDEILYSLNAILNRKQIGIHSIAGRVKTVDSFLEKVERKAYSDPFAQAQDLVGARVVGLFLSDLPKIEQAIAETFDVIDKDDHGVGGAVDTFGYMSFHYICRLGESHAGPRYHDIGDAQFEIQVRTIVMDAWANISHQLAYKNESSIPDELRKDFHALSGLFYVADQHFEMFSKQINQSQATAERAIEADEADRLDVNIETVIALLKEMFPDRRRGDRETIAEFVDDIKSIGYATIGQLQADISRGLSDALEADLSYARDSGLGDDAVFFRDIGIAREALDFSNPEYKEIHYAERSESLHGGGQTSASPR
jgi:putative GTP pyrophosphokinase